MEEREKFLISSYRMKSFNRVKPHVQLFPSTRHVVSSNDKATNPNITREIERSCGHTVQQEETRERERAREGEEGREKRGQGGLRSRVETDIDRKINDVLPT